MSIHSNNIDAIAVIFTYVQKGRQKVFYNAFSIQQLQPKCPLFPIGPDKYSNPNNSYIFNACFNSGMVSR